MVDKPVKVGIAITTYNRRESLMATIRGIKEKTRSEYSIVVADDGSTDGTVTMLRDQGIPTVGGSNRGIAWNKNRALFALMEVLNCDVLILIEDDAVPVTDGWEADWIAAALRYGHVNYAGSWFRDMFIAGSGTVEDPIQSKRISGQCVAFSRAAMQKVGYLDTRFVGYGYEHAEHSERMLRAGHGGLREHGREGDGYVYYLINGGIEVRCAGSYRDEKSLAQNAATLAVIRNDPVFRLAWRSEQERTELLDSMNSISPARSIAAPARTRDELVQRLWRGHDPWDGLPARLYEVDVQGWNSNHPYLREAVETVRPRIVVEVGVWKGGSTFYMAKHIKERHLNAAVIAVDTWLGSWDHWTNDKFFRELSFQFGYPMLFYKFMNNARHLDLTDAIVPLPLDSLNAANTLRRFGIHPDIVHIDSGHDYQAVTTDLTTWWNLLSPGGQLIVDDYFPERDIWKEVRRAVEDFFVARDLAPIEHLNGKGRVRKPAPLPITYKSGDIVRSLSGAVSATGDAIRAESSA